MSIESVMLSNHLILCQPLLFLPSVFPSIRVFPKSWLCVRWSKFWIFSFSISPSDEYSGLISFRFVWFDLLTVQGTLKSLHQHHSSKASILWSSAFFMVHLSHSYRTTGKTTALTIQTFVIKVMTKSSLSRFVIAFLPGGKCLLISWLQSGSTVILEPRKINLLLFHFFLIYCHKWWGENGTFHSCDPHSHRLLRGQWSRNECYFWNSLAFSVTQWMLAIWSPLPLPFLNPACTSESLWFTHCWNLAWRILSITLLAWQVSAVVQRWCRENSRRGGREARQCGSWELGKSIS